MAKQKTSINMHIKIFFVEKPYKRLNINACAKTKDRKQMKITNNL